MQFVEIQPTPDRQTFPLGKPKSMTDEECGTLIVRLDMDHFGNAGLVSEWVPSDRERELIAAGQPVRLMCIGLGHPPVSLWVREVNEA